MKNKLVLNSVDDLKPAAGEEIVTDFLVMSQERVNLFALCAGDSQWIHTDVERAKRESPYGGTIAHGFLEVAMMSPLMREAVAFLTPLRMTVNYGLDHVRFPSPCLVGSRIRARIKLAEVSDVPGGLQAKWDITLESEGAAKPCCVATWLVRYLK